MEFQEKSKPIYLQIVDRMADLITDGVYEPGQRIPSVREYATSLQVNPNTVMRSYEYLSREGIIYNRRGIGFFLADEAPQMITQLNRREFFEGDMQLFFRRLVQFNVSPQQLAELYEGYLNENHNNNQNKDNKK